MSEMTASNGVNCSPTVWFPQVPSFSEMYPQYEYKPNL